MRGSQLKSLVALGSVCATLIFVFQFSNLWATKTVIQKSQPDNARAVPVKMTQNILQPIQSNVKPQDSLQPQNNGNVKPQSNDASPPQNNPTDSPLPSDSEIAKLDENQLMKIYSDYMKKPQVTCNNIKRVGRDLDGGKDVCLDEKYYPQKQCLVYSFGSCNDFSFDIDVVKKFGCEVHVFDPSMNQAAHKVSDRVWFYNWGLSNVNAVNGMKWTMKTLDVIMKELGHANKTLDMLKIDIEGDEWRAIPQMFATGMLKYARQILMETHFGRERPTAKYWGSSQDLKSADHMKALRQLYEAGFRIFRIEENHWGMQNWPGISGRITNVNEVYMVKV